MLFKLIWNVIKNLRWVITIVLVAMSLYFVFLQYENIKASPIGAFLPSVEIPSFSSFLPTATPPTTQQLTPTPYPSSVKVTVATAKGSVLYTAEVAQTPEATATGLMHRTNLPQYSGMYFIYGSDVQYGFWMKNCEIPLDMLFIDSNSTIVDIKHNVQPCKTSDPAQENCPAYMPKAQYRTVLEINGGSAKTNNIIIGNKVTITP